MGSLIRFEFDKLFRTKSFYICTVIAAGILVMGAVINRMFTGAFLSAITESPYSAWYYAGCAPEDSNLTMIMGIFIALFVCEDNAQNTLKNMISRGASRGKICTAKYLVSLCAAVMMYLFVVLCGFAAGAVLWKVGEPEANPRMILMQLLVFIGFHALYFAIAELIAKPGGAVTATILTPIIIIMVLVLCEALLQRLLDDKAIELSAYWLSAFADTASFSNPEKKELVTAGVGSVIYAAVFYLLGQLFARRREV